MIESLRADFSIKTDVVDEQTVVLIVRGELDLSSAPALEQSVRECTTDGHPRIVIDLTAASFVDSAGIGALVNGRRLVHRAGGRLVVQSSNHQLNRVFELTGLMRRLMVTSDRAKAIDAAQP